MTLNIDWYDLVRLVLSVGGAYFWARIFMLTYGRVKVQYRTSEGDTRLRMMVIVGLAALVAILLLLAAIYDAFHVTAVQPDPFPLVVGVALRSAVFFGGWVLVRTWPKENLAP